MYLPAIIRKTVFALSGRVILSDRVRNSVYQWAWGHLQRLAGGASIIDIGSRDSLFPSFLAWKNYEVRVIERDGRFTSRQKLNGMRWNVPLTVDEVDFLDATMNESCNAVCSLFSLQHAGQNDINAYRKVTKLLAAGGLFLSATEYCHAGTRFHDNRDDGAMRRISKNALSDRFPKREWLNTTGGISGREYEAGWRLLMITLKADRLFYWRLRMVDCR